MSPIGAWEPETASLDQDNTWTALLVDTGGICKTGHYLFLSGTISKLGNTSMARDQIRWQYSGISGSPILKLKFGISGVRRPAR